MYVCQNCNTTVPANTRSYRVVTETRRKEYPWREKANVFVRDGKTEKRDDPGGRGVEIARELLVCPVCARALRVPFQGARE